jgi:cytochrome c oxidase subunit 2
MEMGWPLLLADGEGPNNLSIFDPASPPAESIHHLSLLVLAIAAGIFVVVEAVLFYCVFRFRRRPPPSPPLAPEGRGEPSVEPAQVYGSMPIEIAWTTAPALIVFILVLVIGRTEWEVRTIPDKPPEGSQALNVTVIGHQWWWEYVLDGYGSEPLGVITANELHVPSSNRSPGAASGVRRPVYLTLKSADVCHSYWVPRLAGKTDLIPGHPNRAWFETDREELFLGQCAEFCGTQHAYMLLRVQVDPPETFAAWLENEKKPAVGAEGNQRAAVDPAAEAGKKEFLKQSCVNCHRIRGTPARGTYAPDLTHLMSRKTLAAGALPNTADALRRWVADPQKVKPGCLMPAFGLSERQLDDVVRYLRTLE